ncbi:neuromedin-B isoform X2 [Caretta caretta]|uniref:neuromedin-B isoform X2 n=1 Tax=Caretta caretta TaxID=8467 RepID=UPI002094E7EE|nr:neuromedin-B isoform X2 [Caretta caretta]
MAPAPVLGGTGDWSCPGTRLGWVGRAAASCEEEPLCLRERPWAKHLVVGPWVTRQGGAHANAPEPLRRLSGVPLAGAVRGTWLWGLGAGTPRRQTRAAGHFMGKKSIAASPLLESPGDAVANSIPMAFSPTLRAVLKDMKELLTRELLKILLQERLIDENQGRSDLHNQQAHMFR